MKTPVKERVRKWREKKKKEGGRGVSLILNPEASKQLEYIQKTYGLNTVSEIINKALSILGHLAEKEKNNYEIHLVPTKKISKTNENENKKVNNRPETLSILQILTSQDQQKERTKR